jgi:3-methyladenine DNA glycosylase AlkD
VDDVIGRLVDRLEAAGTPERAAAEKRYLKSDLAFLGASNPQIGAAVKSALGARRLGRDEAVDLAARLWVAAVFERRMAAILVLKRSAGALSAADLPMLAGMVRESGTWALVDALATDVIGRIVEADADAAAPILDRWALDADFWVRRASLLAELRAIRNGARLDRFVGRAEPMLDEREFFIRKAIGWVLREAGKRRPAEVAAWLAPRTSRASGVTMREAVKYLSPADAERLMTAYREKRPAA